jgi:hypothetical protein
MRASMAAIVAIATTLAIGGVVGEAAASRAETSGGCEDVNRSAPSASIVHLRLDNQAELAADTVRELMHESARIWQASGVTVRWSIDTTTPATPDAAVPEIEVVATRDLPMTSPISQRRPLAAILFVDGAPATRITAYPREAERLFNYLRSDDRPIAQRPSLVRHQLLGRMLGRAIAHELGHFLFRTADHETVGLMRAVHSADDLIAPFDWSFRVVAPGASTWLRGCPETSASSAARSDRGPSVAGSRDPSDRATRPVFDSRRMNAQPRR